MKSNVFIITRLSGYAALFISLNLNSQVLHKTDSMMLPATSMSFSRDYDGYLYVGLRDGSLLKLDNELRVIQNFRMPDLTGVSHIESWNPLKIFLYSRDQQQFLFLERFAASPALYGTSEFSDVFIELMTPGFDNSLWILETPAYRLRKLDATNYNTLVEIPLQRLYGIAEVSFMKAYRNLLILSSPDFGLYFFDAYGNLVEKMELTDVDQFSFSEDQLVSNMGDQVFVLDLKSKKMEVLKGPPGYYEVILIGKRFYFISDDTISVYSPR